MNECGYNMKLGEYCWKLNNHSPFMSGLNCFLTLANKIPAYMIYARNLSRKTQSSFPILKEILTQKNFQGFFLKKLIEIQMTFEIG